MLAIVLATLFGCGDLCRPEAMAHYAALLARGGYGRLPFERAGFLIRESDGSLTFAPWPNSDYQSAIYRGSIAAGTVAIVHTHPLTAPNPSVADMAEARRVQLPVVVIAPEGVVMVKPDGAIERIAGRGWWRVTAAN